jgi:sortase A
VSQGPPADQAEVRRLTAALQHDEQRRRTVESTAAAVPPPPARPRRRPARLRRGLLLAGLVAGLLVAVDGILTIAWQEPLTAIVQSRAQTALRSDLVALQRTLAATPRLRRETGALRMRRQALALLHGRKAGAALGTLVIPRIGLKTVFVESTGHDALTEGPGHYRGTVLPGLAGTVGLAGHRTTYGAPFRHVDDLPPGTRIELRMPYGRFEYRVTGTQITSPDNAASLRSRPGAHTLVLTACHPLYSAAKRIVVSARQVLARPS